MIQVAAVRVQAVGALRPFQFGLEAGDDEDALKDDKVRSELMRAMVSDSSPDVRQAALAAVTKTVGMFDQVRPVGGVDRRTLVVLLPHLGLLIRSYVVRSVGNSTVVCLVLVSKRLVGSRGHRLWSQGDRPRVTATACFFSHVRVCQLLLPKKYRHVRDSLHQVYVFRVQSIRS